LRYAIATGFIITLLVLGSLAYWYISTPKEENVLVIYTYEYFFGLTGDNINSSIYQKIFGEFEAKYNVKIEVKFFSGAKNILLKAVAEKKAGARTADLLVGLDNIVIHEAKRQGILEKLDPSKLNNIDQIDPNLINWFDPELYGIPYDFGPIAITYDTKRINITSWTFEDFINKNLDKLLVVESPLTSTTGVSFLLWEIAYYDKILKKDWKSWWENVKDDIIITESWGDAYFGYFLDKTKNRPLVVSYLTSPVYHWLYESTTRYKSALMKYNGKLYAWSQIQGIGIVRDSPMRDIAYKFIDWLLSKEIQDLVAANDIMLPANTLALKDLPEDVKFALGYNLSDIEYLNKYISPTEIFNRISEWLDEWNNIITGTSYLTFKVNEKLSLNHRNFFEQVTSIEKV